MSEQDPYADGELDPDEADLAFEELEDDGSRA